MALNEMIIYHGSNSIINKPIFGYGEKYNDYGLGFYCTQSLDLAREWSVTENNDGYVNKYKFKFDDLNILYLNKYNILYWITILLNNRTFTIRNNIAQRGKDFLLKKYNLDISSFDVVIGYRADDSYFSYAEDFLKNSLSLKRLEEALKLGDLGEQIVLISEKAFNSITFLGSEKVESKKYFPLRLRRNAFANMKYRTYLSKKNFDDIYLSDLMKGDN